MLPNSNVPLRSKQKFINNLFEISSSETIEVKQKIGNDKIRSFPVALNYFSNCILGREAFFN